MTPMVAVLRLMAALIAIAAGLSAASAEELAGRYLGIEDAAGASIEIQADAEGYLGTFYDASGNSQAFKADRNGDVAEAVLDMDQRTVLMRMSPLPYGADVAIIPLDDKGRLLIEDGRLLHFVHEGLSLPKPGPDYVDPPRDARGRITGNSFVASYEFWDPTGVRNGYLSLPDRFRTVMRLFAAVQLDVIWKLCLAPSADQALSLALRGQGVTCPTVIDGIAETQRSGRFTDYKTEVAAQREILRLSVRCADGYPESKEQCDRAARRLATLAVSMETAATVLARYR